MTDPLAIPAGFQFATHAAGIKYPNRKDLGLIIADSPSATAAVFTQNRFAAAPVTVSRETLQNSQLCSGIVVNSGNANAATGDAGMSNAREMAALAASTASAKAPYLVCSTGTIGVQLPMGKLRDAIPAAAKKPQATAEAFIEFAESIMTTDTVRKVTSATVEIDGTPVTITGCAKGSGMIHVNMATMLSYIVTDIAIAPDVLQTTFSHIINRTLNCVTIDGDTSTNDTAIIMASGASGVMVQPGTKQFAAFEEALTSVLTTLSKKLARDGEGATHLVEVTVTGAPTYEQARTAALSVAKSPLVKTAIYGRDANWGRIACALGYSEVPFDPNQTDISLGNLPLMLNGTPLDFSEDEAMKILSQEEIRIYADLKNGSEAATVWTCDLTEKYIEINGSYRT